MKNQKKIKQFFYCRVSLWVIALVATVYWIYWSFHLYTLGFMDEHEYAVVFRPLFYKALLISLIALGISFILRLKSDRMKDEDKYRVD